MVLRLRCGLISLGVEKDGYVVGGEGACVLCRACSDDGLMVFAGGEFGLELGGDGVEARCGVAHDEPRLAGAGVTCAHGAGLAGIFSGLTDL